MISHQVLYLSYDGLTDPLGQSQILPYIEGLSQQGFRFTIVSFEKSENYKLIPALMQELQSKGISWKPFRYTKNPPVVSTLFDLWRLKRYTFRICKKDQYSIVHCRSYITALIGIQLKKKRNLKFIFDMRGFWADERIDGKIWSPKNPLHQHIYRYFKRKELEFLHDSDHVISLTHAGKEVILNKLLPDASINLSVIPCCVDLHLFDPDRIAFDMREKLGIRKDIFILGYVGSIGTWYMLPEMVDFFKELLKKKKESIFLFVTKENRTLIEREFLRAKIDLSHLIVKKADRSEVGQYITAFDWAIFFIKPVYSKQASSPTKQGEIMAMGKPIIYNPGIGDTDRIIETYDAGIKVDSFTDIAYKRTLEKLFSKTIDKKKIRHGSSLHFALKNGIGSYANVYRQCLNGTKQK